VKSFKTQYLQLRVHIDCNSNHCPITTEGVVQYQAEALNILSVEFTLIATQSTVRLQLKSLYRLQLNPLSGCNYTPEEHLLFATQSVYQLHLEPLSGCN
jgi:hypothetical protein